MPAKITLQSGEARPPLHDLSDRGRGEGRANTLFPEPPEDRTPGDPGRLEPLLQRERRRFLADLSARTRRRLAP
ncbi:hypothetical protein J5226_08250 [Lysobacter sp. K5869]|nr:hypothetical protein J5226_08250 [Lysobacter sp. K5869]